MDVKFLKRYGAMGILATMMLGVLTEARLQVRENAITIVRLQEREQSLKEIIKEFKTEVRESNKLMHQDIRYIKRNLLRRR